RWRALAPCRRRPGCGGRGRRERYMGAPLPPADTQDADVARAHVAVRVHEHGTEIDESAGLDDRAAPADELERLGERLRNSGAIDDEIRASSAGAAANGVEPVLALGLRGVKRQRCSETLRESHS